MDGKRAFKRELWALLVATLTASLLVSADAAESNCLLFSYT